MSIRPGAFFLLSHSIQARVTLTVAAVSVLVAAVIGAGLCLLIRHRIESEIFRETRRVATEWIGLMEHGQVPPPAPTARVPLVQLVDSRGRVTIAGPMAGDRPLSTVRPTAEDRFRDVTECPAGEPCVMLTAGRVSSLQAWELWKGEPHFVYAGTDQPPALRGRRLEFLVGAGGVLLAALWTWTTWRATGRILRPINAIRQRMSEITANDLSLRVPQPSGRDEIAQLARAANQTLGRLESAVTRQREFAAVVSHELKSPLTGLRTGLEEALLYPEIDARQAITRSLPAADRMQQIIDELLAFARLRNTPCSSEPVDLGALVRAEAAARTTGVPVHARTEPDVCVLGNRVQLASIVTNLLVNAQRHATGQVDVSAERAGDQALVVVLDDGDGVDEKDRERIFEPFTRLDAGRRLDPGGSGLGLALCRAIAVAHEGSLCVEESPRGARFVLRLPLLTG
ncbi:HAMP domain-containing histidine kinase [Microbispora sp. NEAU-D428]|uniref:sensor histidine kinase n=1 Tax=Microbispora sitophila TaxID=2771537 RepID=UPI00186767AD|nr:HAMP domain-containing sensor histidine kinase [Microbispora sitophila]MBE3009265.1 HAMP domain-containing histidine kinase [Microbispora sitophila]